MTYIIRGAPRTKKNHAAIARRRDGSPFIVQCDTAKAWAKSAASQLKAQHLIGPIESPVHVTALVYRERASGDLVNYLQAIGDVLESPTNKQKLSKSPPSKGCVIVNDAQIVSWDGSRLLKDKDNPRVELKIVEAMNK
jgi:hypothetical protein